MFFSKTLQMKKIKSLKNLSITIFLIYCAFAMKILWWIEFINDAGPHYSMQFGMYFQVGTKIPKIDG